MTCHATFFVKMCLLRVLTATVLVAVIDSYFNIFNGIAQSINENHFFISLNADKGKRNQMEIVNYNKKDYQVLTEDGYILTIKRLGNHKQNRAPVLLMHGILDSSDTWLLQGRSSLGILLADLGYDVWLGNARGNSYSHTHSKFNNNDQHFWNFTWEEIGLYDLPATIDFILNETVSSDIYYVGHSQGTTSFFVMSSLKPEYNKKIKMMFALAPVAWLKSINTPVLRYLSYLIVYDFFPFSVYSSSMNLIKWITDLCHASPWYCHKYASSLLGSDNGLIDNALLPAIYYHYPSSSSVLQFVHYAQLINSGQFRRFDFRQNNIIRYGKNSPPDYNLTSVVAPITLFYSHNDYLSDPKDVNILIKNLPNVRKVYNVSDFNHFDYLYANCAVNFVYKRIINDMKLLEKEGKS